MRKFLALMAAAAMVLVSCTDDPQISLDNTALELTHEGGSCDLTVTSNCDWELICSGDNSDLVYVSQTKGTAGSQTIHIEISENESTSILHHYFTAVAHGAVRDALADFSITQGAPSYVIFGKNALTTDYMGGTYEFKVTANLDWKLECDSEDIEIEIVDPEEDEAGEGSVEDDEPSDPNAKDDGGRNTIIKVTVGDWEGDANRKFVLRAVAQGDEGEISDKLTITQTAPSLLIGNRSYSIKKMPDGRWWMTQDLCYTTKGITIGDGICKIWYPCSDSALDWDSSSEGIITKGLLYADNVAFNTTITTTTARRLEGAQGLCPEGWHIPTLDEFMGLVGKCTNSQVETKTDAPFYDASRGHGSLSMLEEGGFNPVQSGYVRGSGKNFENNGSIQGYLASRGYISTSYIFCSSAYSQTMWYALILNSVNNTADVGYMSNSTTSTPFAGSVRCIKNK